MDFTNSAYDLRSIPTDQVFEKYPDLFILYSESLAMLGYRPNDPDNNPHPALTPSQAVSLVVYTYHHTSPLVRQYAGMHQRRKEVLKLLSFTIETAEDLLAQREIMQYIVGSNKFINHLSVNFCKFEPNSSKWIELCRKQDMLDDVFLVLKEEMAGTDKKSATEMLTLKIKLEDQAQGMQRSINQLSAEIFSGDQKLTDLSAAHRILEQRKPILTPERYVQHKRERQNAAS